MEDNVDYTKCAKFKKCGNDHNWNNAEFVSLKSDVEKIKYFLCDRCRKNEKGLPFVFYMGLKNAYEGILKGTNIWTNKS